MGPHGSPNPPVRASNSRSRGRVALRTDGVRTLPAAGRAGSEELDDLLFDGRDLELSRVDPDLAPGAVVEHREGELAPPGGVHRFDELLVVSAAFLAVVAEGRLLFGEELLDGRLLLLEVGGDAENGETRAAVLLLESREQRELLPARHAPRRPEVDEDDPALLPGDGLEESARVELAREPGRGGAPESPRPENGGGEKRRSGPASAGAAVYARLIVQPKAFVTVFSTVLPDRSASRAFFRSGELDASSWFSVIRPW